MAIQRAAIIAYQTSEELPGVILGYQNRRNIIVEGLQAQALEWSIEPPKATLYIWVPVPKGYTLTEFVTLLLEKCGLIVPLETGMILLRKAC
ncbi:hypothetical protein H6H02_09310 [Coleofasciculus sp. FACHB-1120]|nr:hypothetical protein [Coleofasciculus sp. FACHB-1120]MBD2741787.1 hypothetical protein [Coleofasciculus sp. FACHB-1120]